MLQVDVLYPLETLPKIKQVAEAVGSVIDREWIEVSTNLWQGVILFVQGLQKKCTNKVFIALNGRISATILRKFAPIDVHDEDSKKAIVLLCLKSVGQMADAMSKMKMKFKHLRQECMNCVDELFDLMANNLLLFMDPFHRYTVDILYDTTYLTTKATQAKYLDLVSALLHSNNPEVIANIFEHCIVHDQLKYAGKLVNNAGVIKV